MGFFKKLFSREPEKYVDKRGMYYYVDCHKCHKVMRVRIDKTYDLNREDNGFSWRKTLVCDKCFNKMETDMMFDGKYNVRSQDITGGKYVEAPAEASDADDGARGFG